MVNDNLKIEIKKLRKRITKKDEKIKDNKLIILNKENEIRDINEKIKDIKTDSFKEEVIETLIKPQAAEIELQKEKEEKTKPFFFF
jgi:predicted  nucleic acid-binding Zn-ribbon protein